ncbi:MAG: UDP-2,4-diacetamido-2,4,6-trideoxy-beta-L-altropyranose hydrolase [Bacteroidales bacterium]|nr:UDP-2,4-diacetamido-2,4,6-trideoxy-beta-L-altropyranose hydrolase [Lachnoclostridium sp.]MCM1383437.1 UDP-2,4-diacetamido-2,4,6-trideoxy-beta-L-altropyranose hydrolase [Lachnoclostridium sp.]MCM1464286.1 UDP-2,4-diacetamido-2,4,6-trideoxy-beta-L-altropyranose hydrolase [Bacteroidales bacterium]
MFIIRADGNAKIGAGHLMRCLTIAEALREALCKENKTAEADDILFVCADTDSAKLVEERGFTARALDTDYRKMERELSEWEKIYEEFEQGKKQNAKNKIPCVILIDSYNVTDSYLIRLKKRMPDYTLVLLDDMQEHAYPADVVVNYNIFADPEIYDKLYASGQNRVKLCLGNRYVPVRKQFLDRPYQVADKVERVLITTGGGDIDNIAGRILEALLETEKSNNREKLNYDLILGRFHPGLQEMQEFAAGCPRIHIHHDVRDMAALMESCDLAVTAGGSTIYELATVGVPLICFSYAQNQELMTEYIGREQIAGFAGAYHKDADAVITEIKRIFTEFCQDATKRNKCYLKERQMVDGLGAMRLVQEVLLGINT